MALVRPRLCHSALVSAIAAAGAVIAIHAPASAGVVHISRESQVRVVGAGNDIEFGDSEMFSGVGNFNGSVSEQEGDAPDGTYARGSASQNTTVNFSPAGGGTLAGSGDLSIDVLVEDAGDQTSRNQATAESFLKVVFEVTGENEPFSASGTFQHLNAGASFRLEETSPPPEGSAAISFLAGDDVTTFATGNLSLRPATYEIDVHLLFGTIGGEIQPNGTEAGVTNLQFTVGAGAEPPPVIPLPAGVWAGMLGLTAAARAVKKSRRG